MNIHQMQKNPGCLSNRDLINLLLEQLFEKIIYQLQTCCSKQPGYFVQAPLNNILNVNY